MSLYTIARHPIEPKIVLVAYFESENIEWVPLQSSVRIDNEYSNDFKEIISNFSDSSKIENFIWNNKNKLFESVKFFVVNPRSKYTIDQGNKWELNINNRYVGIFTDTPGNREIDRIKVITKNGGVILVDATNPKEPWIVRTFNKPNVYQDLFENEAASRGRGTTYKAKIEETNFSKDYKDSKDVKESKDAREMKETVKDLKEHASLESYLMNMMEKPVGPLKETLERIDRKTNEISMVKELVQKLEMRVRNALINPYNSNPQTSGNGGVSQSQLEFLQENNEKLKRDLEEYRLHISSLEVSLNDTKHRLATTTSRVEEQIKSKFLESFLHLQAYLEPVNFNLDEEVRVTVIDYLKRENIKDTEKILEILDPYFERYMHQLFTLKMVVQVFKELEWLKKR
ncbi:hypothetical protein B5M42_012940 [Paenibacillus athensensis]|uniref:Uncharacterized protein n=1 Tax=Paenibacillus athensensis TaxID=1967502 RepID=A0A4Y8Q7E1_9BACL|nr:hypothetical protein [Paenibacillus athensensis]MCD1259740.1 hypothetical protein [Paenibacillus athensensis]